MSKSLGLGLTLDSSQKMSPVNLLVNRSGESKGTGCNDSHFTPLCTISFTDWCDFAHPSQGTKVVFSPTFVGQGVQTPSGFCSSSARCVTWEKVRNSVALSVPEKDSVPPLPISKAGHLLPTL